MDRGARPRRVASRSVGGIAIASSTDPVRPLIVLPSDPFGDKIGGIKSFVLDFIRFAPRDFAPEIIGCSSDQAARPVGRWQDLDVGGRPVRYLPVLGTPDPHRRPRVPLSLQFTLAAMARRSAHRFSGRVLQFHNPGVPAGFLGVGAPKVLVVHLNVADIDEGHGESRWGLVPGLLHRFEDVTLPRMDRIFMVNRKGVDFYRRRHAAVADRVTFLPTSVDQSVFTPLADEGRLAARQALLDRLGRPASAEERLVLFVGRLERQKDPLLLLETFALARRSADLRLVVVGEGTLRVEAEKRAVELGVADHVSWLGYQAREDLPTLMNAVDVLLLTSAFEGMPITVLEALASGLPVVSTAVGEVPLVVKDRGNGRLIAERSPTPLAEGVTWVLGQPRGPLAAAAREAVAPYRPDRILQPFFDAHRELHDDRWGR